MERASKRHGKGAGEAIVGLSSVSLFAWTLDIMTLLHFFLSMHEAYVSIRAFVALAFTGWWLRVQNGHFHGVLFRLSPMHHYLLRGKHRYSSSDISATCSLQHY